MKDLSTEHAVTGAHGDVPKHLPIRSEPGFGRLRRRLGV